MLVGMNVHITAAIIHQRPVTQPAPGNTTVRGPLNIQPADKHVILIVRVNGQVEGMPCYCSKADPGGQVIGQVFLGPGYTLVGGTQDMESVEILEIIGGVHKPGTDEGVNHIGIGGGTAEHDPAGDGIGRTAFYLCLEGLIFSPGPWHPGVGKEDGSGSFGINVRHGPDKDPSISSDHYI